MVSMRIETVKELADAEGRSMTAKLRPNDTAAIALMHCSLPNEYVMTFPVGIAEYNNADTTLRSDAG